MAGEYERPGLGPEPDPDGIVAPERTSGSLREIAPARWVVLGLNIVLLAVCAFAFATSPLVPWYRAPNANAAPLAATPSATAPPLAPTSSPQRAAPTSTSTPTPHGSGGGSAPTSTPTHSPTPKPTPTRSPTATPSPIAPTPTNTPCDTCG